MAQLRREMPLFKTYSPGRIRPRQTGWPAEQMARLRTRRLVGRVRIVGRGLRFSGSRFDRQLSVCRCSGSTPANRSCACASRRSMRQAVQRGAGFTRQLLAFSRRQALKPPAVDVARRIMRELLDRTLRGDVKTASQSTPGAPMR
jgi:hypothetical protein